MKNVWIFFIISWLSFSCGNDTPAPNLTNLDGYENLLGVWEYTANEQLSDSTYAQVYQRVKTISADQPGIIFKQTGKFVSKQNAGWCGTPPISYAEYDGTFNVSDKNVLSIATKYWGGKTSYKIEVIELTNKRLMVRTFDQEYEQTF